MKKVAQNKHKLIEKYSVFSQYDNLHFLHPEFDENFGVEQYISHVKLSNEKLLPNDLSIYIHIPFCHSLCYYCGCNKEDIRVNEKSINEYIDHLMLEISMQGDLYDDGRLVKQVFFIGSAANLLSTKQIDSILDVVATQFHLERPTNLILGIEINPHAVSAKKINELSELGFTNFRFSVQSKPEKSMKKKSNTIDEMFDTIAAAVSKTNSISVDLITDLPTKTTTAHTTLLSKLINLKVQQISIFNFAHLTDRIKDEDRYLPNEKDCINLIKCARKMLHKAGYVHIGTDLYVLPTSALYRAQRNGDLSRNYYGYSAYKNTDVIGLGVNAISKLDTAYSKNIAELNMYKDLINNKVLPILNGLSLSPDDVLRASIVQQIMCRGRIDLSHKISRYISWNSEMTLLQYFKDERANLKKLAREKLIEATTSGYKISEKGKFHLNKIASIFEYKIGFDNCDQSQPIVPFFIP